MAGSKHSFSSLGPGCLLRAPHFPFLDSHTKVLFSLRTLLPLTMGLFSCYYQSFWLVWNIQNTLISAAVTLIDLLFFRWYSPSQFHVIYTVLLSQINSWDIRLINVMSRNLYLRYFVYFIPPSKFLILICPKLMLLFHFRDISFIFP